MWTILFALFALCLSIPLGAIIAGLDRRLSARFQSRQGPPLSQPFWDVLKLFGKETCVSSPWLIFCAYINLLTSALTLFIFFVQGNLLMIFFVSTIGSVFRVIGALASPSPFGNAGAHRDLLQMLAYEPLVILSFVGLAFQTGSFSISNILTGETPLLLYAPFLYLALGYALTIKLAKSPFDIASSHHGHQEVVSGVLTEYSGTELALLEIAHWLDVIFVLGLCALFWHTNFFGMLLLLVFTYIAEILIDNMSARLSWQWMIKKAYGASLLLAVGNILYLYVVL